MLKETSVFVFGSSLSGLQISKLSDLDLIMWCPYTPNNTHNCLRFLKDVSQVLKKESHFDSYEITIDRVLENARVPLIIMSVTPKCI